MRAQVRTLLPRIAPPWLLGDTGRRLLHVIGAAYDAALEWALSAVLARFATKCDGDALPSVCRERRIVRGFDETDESVRQRLTRFRPAWRRAGHAYSILEAVWGYMQPHACMVRLYTAAGTCYTRTAAGVESYELGTAWDWDGAAASWSRFWVVIYAADAWDDEGEWGDDGTYWGDAEPTWGTSATATHVATVRALVATWKPAHTTCTNIIIALDPATFDPTAPEPDGTWGPWGKGDPRIESRLDTARYWDGVQ